VLVAVHTEVVSDIVYFTGADGAWCRVHNARSPATPRA
jgi:hypothetical protein